jgi:hypothetical protein
VLSSSGTFPVSSGGSDYSDWIKSSPAPYPENIAGAPGPGFYACCIVGTNTDTVFPPDSEFTAAGSEFAFVIDANSVATPESGSFVFLSLGIACLLGLRRVYRDKFAHH